MTNTRSMDKKIKAEAKTGEKHAVKEDELSTPAPPAKTRRTNGKEHAADAKAEEHPGKSTKETANHGSPSSSVLEKGLIYFFFRGRVSDAKTEKDDDEKDDDKSTDEHPHSLDDVARSYMVLRPLKLDEGLKEGAAGNSETSSNSRLLVLPKKVLPSGSGQRWIVFAEKPASSMATLRDSFLGGRDYDTKTAGKRHVPAATPVGEGVYALTTTGRESHLAYLLTLPADLGEVQRRFGLRARGSFIISTRNPEFPAPKQARLPHDAQFPQE